MATQVIFQLADVVFNFHMAKIHSMC